MLIVIWEALMVFFCHTKRVLWPQQTLPSKFDWFHDREKKEEEEKNEEEEKDSKSTVW